MSAPRTEAEFAIAEARIRELESALSHAAREIRSQAIENKRLKAALVVATRAELARRDALRRAG